MKQLAGQICAKTFIYPADIFSNRVFRVSCSLYVRPIQHIRIKQHNRTNLYNNTESFLFVVDNTESLMIAIPAMRCRLPRKNYLLVGKY